MDRLTTERHLKQNKEIIRINQVQSNRITALETEITKLLSENIQLRTQVIQLTHRQDISSQKAQLEKKVREIHRLVKSLGATSVLPVSPVPAIIKKSPKKTNLLSVSPEGSPERSALISTRSKPRSLNAGPSRVASDTHDKLDDKLNDKLDDKTEDQIDLAIQSDAFDMSPELSTQEEARRESRERVRERVERRSSRRMSRASEEIVPLSRHDLHQDPYVPASPVHEQRAEEPERGPRKKTRFSSGLAAPAYQAEGLSGICRSPTQPRSLPADNEDKENAISQRRTTARVKSLNSSPLKTRTALNVIVDPLPTNIQVIEQTPLKEVAEIKSEPTSPSVGDGNGGVHDQSTEGRSRRARTVNYAEPSLRVKMRRTESMPGDKRRKSTYSRVSNSAMDETRAAHDLGNHTNITIEED